MESKQNLKVIQEAINQLLVEEEEEEEDGDRRTLLSDLRSELEEEEKCGADESEMMKELNKIKRQNLITHGLVSAMILVTLTWQLSQVSLILKIKHALSSPLESLGGIAKRFFNGQSNVNVQQVMQQASSSIMDKVSFQSPSLKLPYLEFGTSEEEEED